MMMTMKMTMMMMMIVMTMMTHRSLITLGDHSVGPSPHLPYHYHIQNEQSERQNYDEQDQVDVYDHDGRIDVGLVPDDVLDGLRVERE